jgi:hypothetical protein
VREGVAAVLVEGVEAAARAAALGGDVLVLPPPVDQAELGQAAERPVDGDLRDSEAIGELQAVERGLAGPVEARPLGQHPGVELEHVPRLRLHRHPPKNPSTCSLLGTDKTTDLWTCLVRVQKTWVKQRSSIVPSTRSR